MESVCEGMEEERNTASVGITQKSRVSMVWVHRGEHMRWLDCQGLCMESQWVFPAWDGLVMYRAAGTEKPVCGYTIVFRSHGWSLNWRAAAEFC